MIIYEYHSIANKFYHKNIWGKLENIDTWKI